MKKFNPDISVSLVNYNSSQYLTDCLQSIAKHAESLSIEVLIVDNASENFEPSSIYKIFPDAIVTCNQKNMGFAFAQKSL